MAAIQRTRISPSVLGMFVAAVAVALLVGGVGGYLVRAVNSQVSAPAIATENRPVGAADQLPDWLQNYNAPREAPQFEVDEFIRGLDYTPSVKVADLPAWVQRYMTPAGAPRFKVDEFIRSLDYASLEAPRGTGPGGQLGDSDETSRVGGPGGQTGDAP